MANVATIRVITIKSYSHGSNRYLGIKRISIDVQKGNLRPKKDEGEFYPTGSDSLGIDGWPVTLRIQAESMKYLMVLLALAKGTVVFVGQADGSNSDQTFTISNVEYDTSGLEQERDKDGMFTLVGKAHADTGTPTALPLAIT